MLGHLGKKKLGVKETRHTDVVFFFCVQKNNREGLKSPLKAESSMQTFVTQGRMGEGEGGKESYGMGRVL